MKRPSVEDALLIALKASMLDNAARMRREAQRRQEAATVLCSECRGPDGEHVSECPEGLGS